MLGFQDKGKKTHPPGIFNSNVKPTKESKTNGRNKRCDKCKILGTPCSPDLHHCKESGHQKGQSLKDSSIKSFFTTTNCIHCMKQLQKNIAKAQRESLPTPQLPPPEEKEKCDKCKHMNKPCLAKFNHCKLTGHQVNQPQEDKKPSTWNNKGSCPFCMKGTHKTRNKATPPISSIVDDPIPPIPTLPTIPTLPNNRPMMPIQPNNRNPGFSPNKATPPIAPFPNKPTPPMAPFKPNRPTPRMVPFQSQGNPPRDMRL